MFLHDLFAVGRAQAGPTGVALRWLDVDRDGSESSFSYDALFAAADGLAATLAGKGLERGDRVALFLGNRPEWVVAFLAVLRLGGVVVPMNLAYRRHELEHIVNDATPKIIVTEAAQREVLAEVPRIAEITGFIDVDVTPVWGPAGATPGEGEIEFPRIDGGELAMLLYTSGTTGKSKGAMISHDNFLATITGLLAAWGWSPSDRLLLTLPLFHTHGLVVGLCCALAAGATVELRRRFRAEDVWADLATGRISLFFGVPTMYTRLLSLAEASVDPDSRAGVGKVRLFCSGSAPLAAETMVAFEAATGQVILERYGMTETGMLLSNPLVGERRAGTVGCALPGVSARIVDANDHTVADGVEGELQVRGSNVFGGYWRDLEKTRASFAVDEAGDRWFRTGDLARRDPSHGAVTLLGRRHELIISGGYNIYPREIEELLCELPGILEAAVVGRPHPEWGEVPVAFVVALAALDLAAVEAECRIRIASYKVPKQIRLVASLPRNALGKVQKHLLRDSG